jgi:hypothetical protein
MNFSNRKLSVIATGVILLLFLANTSMAQKKVNYDPNVPEELRIRDGLPNFFDKMKSGGPVRIAYFGGSITVAKGWRPKTLEWFRTRYPDAQIEEINAAISGTGSDFGACRIYNDVLSKNPDLIFMEHRVNGGAGFEALSVEGIVRQIWKNNPKTDICLIYTVSTAFLRELQANKTPAFGAIMESIANTYGIPSIELGLEVSRLEKSGSLLFMSKDPVEGKLVFTTDGGHPTDAGHNIYREIIARSMIKMEKAGKAKRHKLPEPMDLRCWDVTYMIPVGKMVLSSGWSVVDSEKDVVYREDILRTDGMLRGGVKCENTGETITVKWNGTIIGFSDIPQGKGMQVEVVTDKSAPVIIKRDQEDMRRRYSRFFYLPEQLPGDHTTTIKVKNLPDGLSYYAGQTLVIGKH